MLLFSALAVFVHTLFASAQTTNATCGVAHKWAFNSQNLSPCQVASSLIAVCAGSYIVNALPGGFHYQIPSPQDANSCWCNSVAYSLFSECALCQDQTFVQWSVWEAKCDNATVSSFPVPLPAGLNVPGWAYQNVATSDTFNETLAFDNANATESTAAEQPSKTSSVPTSTATVSPSVTPASSLSEADTGPRVSHSNVVGGSVVGGILGLALLFGVAFCVYRRRRLAQTRGARLDSPVMSQTQVDGPDAHPTQPPVLTTQASIPSITVSSLHSQSASAVPA